MMNNAVYRYLKFWCEDSFIKKEPRIISHEQMWSQSIDGSDSESIGPGFVTRPQGNR